MLPLASTTTMPMVAWVNIPRNRLTSGLFDIPSFSVKLRSISPLGPILSRGLEGKIAIMKIIECVSSSFLFIQLSCMSVDLSCYERLQQKFEFLFEANLIKEICQQGQLRKIMTGQVMMNIGDDISHMPLLLSGVIKVMMEDKDGEELLLYYLEWGDTCAVTMNCCTKKAKSAIRAVAEEDSEILMIPVAMMERWMIKYASWRNFVLESYNARLQEMVLTIHNLVFHSLEERLAKYLRDRAMVNHTNVLNITHADIARDLHSSREVISRLMKKLEKQNVISQGRNQIEVLEFSP